MTWWLQTLAGLALGGLLGFAAVVIGIKEGRRRR